MTSLSCENVVVGYVVGSMQRTQSMAGRLRMAFAADWISSRWHAAFWVCDDRGIIFAILFLKSYFCYFASKNVLNKERKKLKDNGQDNTLIAAVWVVR